MLQLVNESHGNAWPDRAVTWTGQWQDRALSTLLIAAGQRHGDANLLRQCSRAHNTGQSEDMAETHMA